MGIGRQPRALVRVNGTIVPGWVNWTVGNNSFAEADTYHLVFAASKLPSTNDAKWFADQTETFIEILAGFPSDPSNPNPNELTSLIYGRIDDLEFDPVEELLTLTGRDLTGAFIDAKVTTFDYASKRASYIATALANAHGLKPQVTATSTYVGNYYQLDTMQLQANRTEWDFLAFLARSEGFVVYVTGKTLYFGPDQTGKGSTLNVTYQPGNGGSPTANVLEMSFSRSQTVVKGITVTVMSGPRQNPSVTKSYPTAPKSITPGKSSPYGATTNYYFNMPAGATPQQVGQRAQALYNQIIQHAMKFKCRMPADMTTDVSSSVVVSGTGTGFDQTYFPRLVTRSMHFEEGFVMDIDAQNTSPNLTPADV